MLLFSDHNWSWIFYIFLCLLLQRHKLRNSIILVSLTIQHMIYDNHNNNGGWRRDIDNTVYVITSNAFNFEYFKVYKFNKLLCPIKTFSVELCIRNIFDDIWNEIMKRFTFFISRGVKFLSFLIHLPK